MSEGSESDRSELPTAFKLSQARRKGQAARGADLGFLTGLATFCACVWFYGDRTAGEIGELARRVFITASGVDSSPSAILEVTAAMMTAAARPLALLAGAVFLVVLVFEVIQTGPVFSADPLKMDFSRLNPATGLKKLFSVRLLIETLKSIVKMMVYGALAVLAVRTAIMAGTPAISSAETLAGGLQRSGFRMLAVFLAAAAGFAILDQLITRRDFTKRMRMSRRDVRRESRDREGEPRLKQRRKQLHREFVKASESLRGIKGADVLVVNPTHFAVALRYDPRRMDAPLVVSRGAHRFALRLRRLAFVHGVVIVREPPLARALYRCELNQPVPEALYARVADIYRALRPPAAAAVEE